jgi:DNA-binding SARP family transcriptional activator
MVMARLPLSLLGPFKATLNGDPVTNWPSAKVRALLAYLAVEADHSHPREVLAGLLWPDYAERSAHTNLSNALSHLRTLLHDREPPSPCLTIDRETMQFDRSGDSWVEMSEFADLMRLRDLSGLKRAVELYRGPFLEGFALKDSPPLEQWALVMRERLQRQMRAVLQQLAGHQKSRGS